MATPSNSLQQLMELRKQGSQAYAPDAHAIDKQVRDGSPPPATAKWWNVARRIKQAFQNEKAEADIYEQDLQNFKSVQQHANDVRAQTASHRIEVSRILVDDAAQARAVEAIAAMNLRASVRGVDAVELLSLYTSTMIDRVNNSFADPVIRERASRAIRAINDHQLTEIQLMLIGMKSHLNTGGIEGVNG